MKKSLCIRMMPTLAVGLLILLSACKQNKPLQLQGEWQEASYWIPNDSIAADTLIHTYTLRNIRFDCDFTFRLKLTTYHHAIPDDPALGSADFTEYVKGDYQTAGKNITLTGRYYTDDTYETEADSVNTLYNFGDYKLETSFKLDDKRLILGATTDDIPSQHTFSQTEAIECY
ncbi:MAG: hypothetical protein K2O01_01475 [Bacteroidales bacterium]|nr:hypothetical protein [Bacteroidales bacterium]